MNRSTSKTTLAQTFLVGLTALLPLALTIAAISWCADLLEQFLGLDSTFGRMLIAMGLSFIESRAVAYVLGAFFVLCTIYLLGVGLQWGLAKRWQNFIKATLSRIPVVGNIYDLADRLIGVFGTKDDPALENMVPVWCFLGGENGASVLGLLPNPEPVEIAGSRYLGVLIPLAPVPFGGGLVFVPEGWVKRADFGLEGLTSIYVTMGVTAPSTVQGAGEVTPEGAQG